jgi:hypothetical protein
MSYSPFAEPLRKPPIDQPMLLSWADLDVVQRLLAEIAPSWSAELNQASADESTIVVTPEGANDLIGPAFILQRTRTGVELSQFRWDEYRKLGNFLFLDAALAVLRTRLVPLRSRSFPDAE